MRREAGRKAVDKRFLIARLMPIWIYSIVIILSLWPRSGQPGSVEKRALSVFHEELPPLEVISSRCVPLEVESIIPTFLFVREKEELYQLAKVIIKNGSPANVEVELGVERPGGKSWEEKRVVGSGREEVVVRVPDCRRKSKLILTVRVSGGGECRLVYDWPPAKQWTVYLTHLSHFDYGYTGTHKQVEAKWDRIISRALAFTRETADWPEEARFRYTLDASFPLKLYLDQHPDKEAEIAELARQGLWEVNAKLAHLCTSTTSSELLARELYYTKGELEKKFGVDFPTAIHTDVPGITWGNVSVYTQAGLKYLLFHSNRLYRGAQVTTRVDFPHAYYWQGPDGSRILTWRAFTGYTECRYLIEGLSSTALHLPEELLRIEEEGYPYDIIHFTRSGLDPVKNYDDNSIPRLEIFQTIREWNEHFAFPRLLSATPRLFFSALEKQYSAQIPTARGDKPDWWADGILTDARETAAAQRLHHLLAELEFWSTAALLYTPRYDYPAREIAEAVLSAYLYDEHTWGYIYPFLPPEERIFKTKAERMLSGLRTAELFRGRALYALARAVGGTENRVVVFNPVGRTRSGPVLLRVGKEQLNEKGELTRALADMDTGALCFGQVDRHHREGADALFWVRDVPGFGWRVYRLVPAPPELPQGGEENTASVRLENEFGIFTFERSRGGLVSWYDKESGEELVDPEAEFAFGQVFGRRQGLFDLYDLHLPGRPVKMSVSGRGPVFTEVTMVCRLPDAPFTRITARYRIYEHRPGLDFTLELEHYYNDMGASKYAAFPFALPDAEVWVETPLASMRPGRDQLPGFATFYVVDTGVRLEGGERGIFWSALEAPMVEFASPSKPASFVFPYGEMFGRQTVATDPPHLYSELMNNFQNTNYHYVQQGSISFHYRICPYSRSDSSRVRLEGLELARALTAMGVEGGSSPALPVVGSVLEIKPETVELITLKRAEDGRGVILRLYSPHDQETTLHLSFPGQKIRRAFLTDITEHEREELLSSAGEAALSLPPFALRTLRLELNPAAREGE